MPAVLTMCLDEVSLQSLINLGCISKHPDYTPVYPRLLHSYASQVNPFCFKMHTVEQSVAPQNLDRVLREVTWMHRAATRMLRLVLECIELQLGA